MKQTLLATCVGITALAGGAVPAQAQARPLPPSTSLSQATTGAAQTLQAYYAALAARRYQDAYLLWDRCGAASGKSLAAFTAGFSRTRSTAVHILRGGIPDGAAGSMSVAIAVRVDAKLVDGREQHFAGTYVLRRVNNVPGATLAQLRWHIASANLRAVLL